MAGKASLLQVRDYIAVPGKPVSMSEMKALTVEDRAELCELVGVELGLPDKDA